jgi:hypothetical protein
VTVHLVSEIEKNFIASVALHSITKAVSVAHAIMVEKMSSIALFGTV